MKVPENIMDVMAGHAAEGLLARLEWMTLAPTSILIMGREVETLSERLQARFPEAVIGKGERFDLIIANLELPWQDNLSAVIKAWQLYLKPEGLLMVSALGPDTLKEWSDQTIFTVMRVDMHEVGDALVVAGLSEPVMEVEHYTITYKDATTMLAELCPHVMPSHLAQPSLPAQMDDKWHVTFELVYGHAWAPSDAETANVDGVTKVPLSLLRRHLKSKAG